MINDMVYEKVKANLSNGEILPDEKQISHRQITILLVDDSNAIRETLCSYLEPQPDFEIVGSVDNARSALEQTRTLNPDIVLMDIEMPEIDGLEATRAIAQQFKESKVIVLSIHDDEQYIDRVLEAGARGYLLKTIPMEELAYSIRFVHKGYLQFSPGVLEKANSNRSSTPTGFPEVERAISESDTEPLNGSSSLAPNLLHAVNSDSLMPSPNRWIRLGTVFLVGTIAIAVGLAAVIKYKVTVKAPATVRPAGDLRLVQAATEGTIESIEVRESQSVKRGEVIALIDNSSVLSQKEQLQEKINQSKQQLQQIEAQIEILTKRIESETYLVERNIAAAKANLNRDRREYQDRRVTTEAELEEAKAALALAAEELKRYRQLAETGAVSRLQISEKQQAFKAAQARVKRSEALTNPDRAAIEMAEEQIAQEKFRGQSAIAILNQEKENLINSRIEIQNRLNRDRVELQQLERELNKSQLKAPIAGDILQLQLRNPGQVVKAGDTITQIAPLDAPLRIKARVAARDISKVELCSQTQVDQCETGRVKMRFSAYPYPDYGVLSGAVREISADTVTPQVANDTSDTTPYYEVTIEPERNYFLQGVKQYPIQPGMEVTADIISREETVLKFILRKARLIGDLNRQYNS